MIIPMVSAGILDYKKSIETNGGDYNINGKVIKYNKLWATYNPIEIKNILGKTKVQIALTEHTTSCGDYNTCISKMEIYLADDGILIEDNRFYTLQENGLWIEQDIRWSQFQYRLDTNEDWINYHLGDEVKAGIYEVQLLGNKKKNRIVDWRIETQGKVIEELAVWGNISGGDDAEVILNSPADASTFFTNLVTFNATANITGGAFLVNMSLWTNESGSWGLKDIISPIYRWDNGSQHSTNDPDSFNNPGNAFDENDTSFAHRANPNPNANDVLFLGKTFSLQTIREFRYKAGYTYDAPSGTGNFALKLQSYNGSGWSDVTTLETGGEGSNTYEDVYNFNDTTQGLRLAFSFIADNPNSGTYTAFAYSIEYETQTAASKTKTFNSTITDDIIWNVQSCDTDGDCGFAPDNYSLFIDADLPTIEIESPTGLFDALIQNKNITLNFTATDSNLDTCWLAYNNTNTTISCTSGVKTVNSFNYQQDQNNLTIYANDSVGGLSSNFTSWSFKIFQNSATFQNATIEGSTENFQLNFSTGGSLQSSIVKLIYDGVEYASTFLATNGFVITNNDIPIPNINQTINNSFFWSITLSDDSIINTSVFNQTVSNLTVDDCGTFSNLIFNYTHLDEEFQTIIDNNSIEISINIFDSERENIFVDFSNTYNNTNPAQVCINTALGINTNYSVDSVVKYSSNDSSGYALEYFNLLNFTLANTTVPVNTNLFSLLEEDSTEFQLTFRDGDLALSPNIVVSVNRQYVSDNDFKTVEQPVTDTNGQAILHLVRNDIQYNFIMTDSAGNIVATFNKKNVFCQDFTIGSCTLNLNAVESENQVFDIISDVGIIYTTSFNTNTNILALEFVSLDLTSKKVGLVATRDTDFGNRSVCNEELTSSSGIINCNVSHVSSTDRYLFLEIFVEDKLKATETEDLDADDSGTGQNGLFLAFFILLAIVTIFMEDKKTLLISLGLGWVAVISFGLVKGTLFGSLSAGIWLIVTIIIFMWKLSKEDSP